MENLEALTLSNEMVIDMRDAILDDLKLRCLNLFKSKICVISTILDPCFRTSIPFLTNYTCMPWGRFQINHLIHSRLLSLKIVSIKNLFVLGSLLPQHHTTNVCADADSLYAGNRKEHHIASNKKPGSPIYSRKRVLMHQLFETTKD
jgi:hypothetical protein